jgi:hypothetical protein
MVASGVIATALVAQAAAADSAPGAYGGRDVQIAAAEFGKRS